PALAHGCLHTLCGAGGEGLALREEAWKGFATLDDPLATLLDMLDASRGCGGRGPSLEAWVARELERWLQAQPRPGPTQGDPALKPLQVRAVRLLTEGPLSLVEPLLSIFQLQHADRSPVLARIHRLHQEGKFKEAIVLGTKLQLQADLDVEKMCVPLLLQDKVGLAERYVAGLPHLQRRLLTLIDSWCQPGFDVRVVASAHPTVFYAKRRGGKLSFALLCQPVHGEEQPGLESPPRNSQEDN
ncbi:hypothetical protein FD754_023613, partial [Muntiacus muntjak]